MSIFRFAAIARETVAIVGIHACGTYSLLDRKAFENKDDPCAFHSSPEAGPGSELRSRAGWQGEMSA
jgi:hypothetical protein